MSFVLLLVVTWAVSIGAWIAVNKYLKSTDVDKVKQRLMGAPKKNKKKKDSNETGEAKSVIQSQAAGKNKVAQLIIEKYKLGPKIGDFLEQAGLRWAPARLVHLCWMTFLASTIAAWLLLPIPKWMGLILGLAASGTPVVF